MSEVYAHRGHANIRTHRTNEFALDIDDTATTGFAASSTAIPPAETNVPSLQDVGIEADAASRTDRRDSALGGGFGRDQMFCKKNFAMESY